eukprot:6870980-Pyramimonas_sp.AAC.1
MTTRRPNTYITVRDMRRIQEYVADSRRPPVQPGGMDVDDETDHDPDSTTPPSDHDDEEGQGGSSAL